jgi:hypothetical protein
MGSMQQQQQQQQLMCLAWRQGMVANTASTHISVGSHMLCGNARK